MDTGSFPVQQADLKNQTLEENQAADRLVGLLDRLEFEQARSLARNGDYPAAQAILLNLLRRQTDPITLDLLARVYAQQGLFSEARTTWEKAVALAPKTPEYAAGLACLARIQKASTSRKQAWLRGVTLAVGVVLILLVVILIIWVDLLRKSTEQVRLSSENLPTQVATEPIPISGYSVDATALAAFKSDLEKNNQDLLAEIKANQHTLDEISIRIRQTAQPTVTATATVADSFSLDLRVPGTTLIALNPGFQVCFDERLFLFESLPSTRGEEMLKQLGSQLEPLIGKIQIKVVGYTDALEKDRQNLALERATAVTEYLIGHTRLPVSMFTIASGEGQPSPFPTNSNGDPFRNRTVVLNIFPIQKQD